MTDEQKSAWQEGLKEDPVIDSSDWQDLFFCGMEAEQTCQSVYGGDLSKCLLGYVLDGKCRIIGVKNADGKVIARSIIKLLVDDRNRPVIFLGEIYGDAKFKDAIINLAKKKAAIMKVPLCDMESSGEQLKLASNGSVGYEYEDATDPSVTTGYYTISASLVE